MYQMKLTYQRPTITLFRVMSEGGELWRIRVVQPSLHLPTCSGISLRLPSFLQRPKKAVSGNDSATVYGAARVASLRWGEPNRVIITGRG